MKSIAPDRPTPTDRPRRGAGGFTLIELLVVVAIIALLVSILVPSLTHARQIAQRTLCATNLRSINLAVAMYTDDYNDVYPCAQDPVSTDPYYWLWMGRGWRGFVERYLGTKVTADNPSVLACRSDPALKDTYEATSYAYSMAFYHSPEQIDAMGATSDLYSAGQVKPSIGQRTQDVTEPTRKILIGEWTSNHDPQPGSPGWWSWQGSRTFLFADGQIRYLAAEDILPARDSWPDPNLTVGGITGRDID